MEKVELNRGCESDMSYYELVSSIAEIAQAGAAIRHERSDGLGSVAVQCRQPIKVKTSEEQ